jgi:phage repressor protein C with HTH and peptisase S24 domain
MEPDYQEGDIIYVDPGARIVGVVIGTWTDR